MKLEVIAKNLNDIIKINQTNADRIEFCRNLEVGGLTPNKIVIWLATKISKKPINVMLRPSDRSFNYNDYEYNQMIKMAKFINKINVNGVVFGILNENNEVDIERMTEIVKLLTKKEKTFHKAFDEVTNLKKSLLDLEKIGMSHVLTAGGKKPIHENLDQLKELKQMEKLSIIAGGGVDWNNINEVSNVTNEIHVGTLARKNKSWNKPIDIEMVNQIKSKIN